MDEEKPNKLVQMESSDFNALLNTFERSIGDVCNQVAIAHGRIGDHKREINEGIGTLSEKIDKVTDKMQKILTSQALFDNHIEEGKIWRMVIIGIVLSLLASVAGVIWWSSQICSMVNDNHSWIQCDYRPFKDRVNEHVIRDEARWNVFDIKKEADKSKQ